VMASRIRSRLVQELIGGFGVGVLGIVQFETGCVGVQGKALDII
jgi:hypothetical protein